MRHLVQPLQFFNRTSSGLLAELDLLNAVCGSQDNQTLVWHTNQSLVVPAALTRMPLFAHAAERSTERGWPVSVRATGGGTTPQGPGILNVCLAFQSTSRYSIHAAYRKICDPLHSAFAALGIQTVCQAVPGSFCDGEFNIVHAGQKLVGTAQRWRTAGTGVGHGILTHGLILHSIDIVQVSQAINAFHHDLELDLSIIPLAHTTVEVAGAEIDESSFTNLLVRHIEHHIQGQECMLIDGLPATRHAFSGKAATLDVIAE